MSKATQLNETESNFLTFDVGSSRFGLPISEVFEILEYREVNRVPGSSAMVHGVFNHSGTIVPVVDLSAKFGGESMEITRRTCVVIVAARAENEVLRVGLLVDAVRDVIDAGEDGLEPAPGFGSKVKLEYLRGLLRTPGKGLTIILSADRFLSAAELMEVSAAIADKNTRKLSSERLKEVER